MLATDFQKYLFLFTTLCEQDKSYDFVPYKFGCYSFQASADKLKLIEKGYLQDAASWVLEKPQLNYLNGLNKGDDKKLNMFASRYASKHGSQLIRHVYRTYPYYAINSEIVEEHLNAEEIARIKSAKPTKRRSPAFATIGYEGGSVESYLNKLIENDIRILIDVRKNPISRKYGFSKRTLSSLVTKLGIEYIHIPELGIDSSDRKNLNNQSDYDHLFNQYEKTVLANQRSALQLVYDLYNSKRRVAITCFEKEHSQCHRSRVANSIVAMSYGEIAPMHL